MANDSLVKPVVCEQNHDNRHCSNDSSGAPRIKKIRKQELLKHPIRIREAIVMTDLSAFGVDVPEDDTEDDEPETTTPDRKTYPNGRCPAIATGTRRRCRADVSRMKAAEPFCGTHGRQYNPWTIDDDPEKLILITGRLDSLSLDDLNANEVDFDLDRIKQAVKAVKRNRGETGGTE